MTQLGAAAFRPLSHLRELVLPTYVIAATTPKKGIGSNGQLPWPKLSVDMKRFKYLTSKTAVATQKNAVIMGRKTWVSLPDAFKPLKDRVNIVLSRTLNSNDFPDGVHVVKSIEEAFALLKSDYGAVVASAFIIGGCELFDFAIKNEIAEAIFLTRIGTEFQCDTFFPNIPTAYRISSISKTFVENDISYDFVVYQSNNTKCNCSGEGKSDVATSVTSDVLSLESSFFKNIDTKNRNSNPEPIAKSSPSVINREHEEFQYLDLIAEIINTGVKQNDRTGVGVLSVFGRQMRFSLRQSFPLITTKQVFWKGIVMELLWFLRGDTNGNKLSAAGVKIWEQNGSREFLDSRGLNYREVGDLGPIYGFQWRHFAAKYVDMHTDYSGQGVDQLKDCIHRLKTDPTDRRIILCAWNPAALKEMALPPCHVLSQFYVENGELSCLMYQRSCDIGLGVPFNIASYSLLTCILAQVCNLKRGDFVYCLGNAHIYTNHLSALKTQLQRDPRPFPSLKINSDKLDIDMFEYNDFSLIGYNPQGKIIMEMAV